MITLHCRPSVASSSAIVATEVRIGRGLSRGVAADIGNRRAFVFYDPVAPRLDDVGRRPSLAHRDGEAGKTLARCEELLRAMNAAGIDRDGLLVAVGGGVVGDLGGLAASLHLRGIEHWQVPTTLLAMVDSAVGGKTAVNLPEGKNLIGTVHPATRVIVDIDALATLDEMQFRSGLAEIVKMAIGFDAVLFELLEQNVDAVLGRDAALTIELVRRSIAAKIGVVEEDPYEQGRRRLLNLGHTLGHALEAHTGFTRPHGHCVARGLHFALAVAHAHGAMPATDVERAHQLLLAYGFARDPLPPIAELMPFLARDKKVTGRQVRFAMPTGIGSSRTESLPLTEIGRLLERDESIPRAQG